MGWKIGHIQDEATLSILQQEVFSVVFIDDSGEMTIVGSAFIVSKIGSQALCLSAAHVFEEIHKLVYGNTKDPLEHLPSKNKNIKFDITKLIA